MVSLYQGIFVRFWGQLRNYLAKYLNIAKDKLRPNREQQFS